MGTPTPQRIRCRGFCRVFGARQRQPNVKQYAAHGSPSDSIPATSTSALGAVTRNSESTGAREYMLSHVVIPPRETAERRTPCSSESSASATSPLTPPPATRRARRSASATSSGSRSEPTRWASTSSRSASTTIPRSSPRRRTTLLAHIAALTKQIMLSTSVTLMTTNDPVKVAEDYAMLQHVAKGRLDLMVGRGNTVPVYPWFGKDIRQGVALALENYNLLHRLWREDVVDWEGSFRTAVAGLHLDAAPARRRAAVRVARLDPHARDRRAGRLLRQRLLREPHPRPEPPLQAARRLLPRSVRALRSRHPGSGDRRPRRPGVHRQAVAGRGRRIPAVLRGVSGLQGQLARRLHGAHAADRRQPPGGHRQDPHVPGGVRRLPAPAVRPRRPGAARRDGARAGRAARHRGRASASQGDGGAARARDSGCPDARESRHRRSTATRSPASRARTRTEATTSPARRPTRTATPTLRRASRWRPDGDDDLRLANEAWEAYYRAQATIARELTDADIWKRPPTREYAVLLRSPPHPTDCGSPSWATTCSSPSPGCPASSCASRPAVSWNASRMSPTAGHVASVSPPTGARPSVGSARGSHGTSPRRWAVR